MADKSTSIAYENINRCIFEGVGEYGIPQIKPTVFTDGCEFIGFKSNMRWVGGQHVRQKNHTFQLL